MTAPSPDIKGQLSHARHELRTPVNANNGYSEMILEDAEGVAPEDFLHRLRSVAALGKRLQTQISDLMGEAKTEGLPPEQFPALIEQASRQMRPVCQEILDDSTVLLQQTTRD